MGKEDEEKPHMVEKTGGGMCELLLPERLRLQSRLNDPEPSSLKAVNVEYIRDWLLELPHAVLSATKLCHVASQIKTKTSLGPKQKAHVIRAVAKEMDSLILRLGQLQMASKAAEKDYADAKTSPGSKRSSAKRGSADSPIGQELGGSKARRMDTDARADSMERRRAVHALLESKYEADYQAYRESMPASASAGKSEEYLRDNFMKDNARRIAKGISSEAIPGPSLQLPEESESQPESETETPSKTDLDNAMRNWDVVSFRMAANTVDSRRP